MKEDKPPGPSWSARAVAKIFPGVSPTPKSREGLLRWVAGAAQSRWLDADVAAMLHGVLDVSEQKVRDVMIPRSQMVVVEADGGNDKALKVIVESGHSRFPVVDDDRDDVDGILLAKDVLRAVAADSERLDLKELLRPAVFVPESKRLNVLLREFRENRNHMALVVDEYGGVSGLVTIEDVLEQIVGEIDDEHDIEGRDADIVALGDGRYSVDALTEIEAFNAEFDVQIDPEEADTVGGLLMQRLGRMPRRGDKVSLDHLQVQVTRADPRRVYKLTVTVK